MALPGFDLNKELDRIDNNGDYAPGNLRWVTTKENARNKPSTTLVSWEGQTYTLTDWVKTHSTVGIEKVKYLMAEGIPLEEISKLTKEESRSYKYSRRKDLLIVEYNNEKLHFRDFVKQYTKLSFVQANKYRLKGWSLDDIAAHTPRGKGV